MAAVLDLRGHIIAKNNQDRATWQLVLLVESKDKRVIDKLAGMTGTSPEAGRPNSVPDWMQRGCAEHCPEKHIHYDKSSMPAIHRWSATGVAAAIVIWNISPYMVNSAPYTELLEEAMAAAVLRGRGSGQAKAAVRRLRDLGWKLPPRFAKAIKDDVAELFATKAG
jgi:hypothetical protein